MLDRIQVAAVATVLALGACGGGSSGGNRLDDAGSEAAGGAAGAGGFAGDAGGAAPIDGGGGFAGDPHVTFQKTLESMTSNQLFDGYTFASVVFTGKYFFVTSNACDQVTQAGGLWVFQSSGALLGKSNVCLDSLAPGQTRSRLTLWAHEWDLGCHQQVLDDSHVLRETVSGASFPYPPMIYAVSNGKVAPSGMSFQLLVNAGSTSSPPDLYDAFDPSTPRITDIAQASGLMVANVTPSDNATYSVPALTQVKQWPRQVKPVTGVGDYVIATGTGAAMGTASVFRLSSSGLSKVQALPDTIRLRYPEQGYALDPADRTRIAIQFSTTGGDEIRIYHAGASGLVLDKTLPVTTPAGGELVALWGQHMLLAGATGATVLKNGQAFPVPDLPAKSSDGTAQIPRLQGAAFSTDGHLVVTTNYGVYLYSLY